MSSKFVRDEIVSFLETEFPTESVIDLTGEFLELEDVLKGKSINHGDPWLGVQFLGSEEIPVDIGATNSRGKYRESGAIYLHVVDVARLGVHNAILNRAEVIRNRFRGRRIGQTILVEGVSPANFGEGITLSFSGGYTAAVIQIDYQRDLDL
jgi:hypothetical protein